MTPPDSALTQPVSHTSKRFQSAAFAILTLCLGVTGSIVSKEIIVIMATTLGISSVLILTYKHSKKMTLAGLTGILLMGAIISSELSATSHWLLGILTALASAITLIRSETSLTFRWIPSVVSLLFLSLPSWHMFIGGFTPTQTIIHGMTLFLVALCLTVPTNEPWQDLTDTISESNHNVHTRIRKTLLLLVCISIVTISLRLWQVDKPALFFDAPLHINAAFDIIDGVTPTYTRNIEYTTLIATSMKWFGESLLSIRLVNAILAGIGVILAGLITLRLSRSSWAAIVAATIMTFHPMEHYVSRMIRGYQGMHVGLLLMTLGGLFLVQPMRSLKWSRTTQQLLGTIACAIGALIAFRFHPLSSVTILACAVAIGIILLKIKTPSRPKKIIKALGILVCTIIAIGLIFAFAIIGDVIIESIAGRFLSIPSTLANPTDHHLWLMKWVPLPLTIIGIAALLPRIRHRHVFVFLFTSIIGIQAGAWLFSGSFHGARYITYTIPFMIILATVGIHKVVHTIQASIIQWQGHSHLSLLSIASAVPLTALVALITWNVAQPAQSLAMPTTPVGNVQNERTFLQEYGEVLVDYQAALTQLQPSQKEGLIFSVAGKEAYRSWARFLSLPDRPVLSANITGSTRSHDTLLYGPYINRYPTGYAVFARQRIGSGCGPIDNNIPVFEHCLGFRNVISNGMDRIETPELFSNTGELAAFRWQHAPLGPAESIPQPMPPSESEQEQQASTADIIATYNENNILTLQSTIRYKHSQKTIGYLVVCYPDDTKKPFIIPSEWFSAQSSLRIPVSERPHHVGFVIVNERAHPDTWTSTTIGIRDANTQP